MTVHANAQPWTPSLSYCSHSMQSLHDLRLLSDIFCRKTFTKMPYIGFLLPFSAIWQLILPPLVIYWLTWIIYARRFHPLAKHPGPFLASITRWWLIVDVARGSAEKTQRRLHAAYGECPREPLVAWK